MDLIYLYCVTKTKPLRWSFEDINVKVRPVYFQGVYAIVGKVSPDEFNEDNLKKNLADMAWVERKVRQHERVIEEIMKDAPVMPFKFGTIFESEENVEKLLKKHDAEYKKIIADLEGKEEWGLKIYCDPGRFKSLIAEDNEPIKKIDEEIASSGKGKAYILKKKREALIDETANKKMSEYTKDSFERLAKASVRTRINKLLPKEVTQKNEDMVFNGAFLINKNRIGECSGILDHLKAKYSGRGLIFDWTGPWPPYNFCDIVKKEV